jgi:hypothetical protein
MTCASPQRRQTRAFRRVRNYTIRLQTAVRKHTHPERVSHVSTYVVCGIYVVQPPSEHVSRFVVRRFVALR